MIRGLAQRLGQFFALIGIVLLIVYFNAHVGGGVTGFDLPIAGGVLLLLGLGLIGRGVNRRGPSRRFRLVRRLLGGHDEEEHDH